jgi:hypothetical protein
MAFMQGRAGNVQPPGDIDAESASFRRRRSGNGKLLSSSGLPLSRLFVRLLLAAAPGCCCSWLLLDRVCGTG